MSTTNDGGPAFPLMDLSQNTGTGETVTHQHCYSGMTLRDYFAAKAMQGLLAQSSGTAIQSEPSDGANYAYRMADSMLKARAS